MTWLRRLWYWLEDQWDPKTVMEQKRQSWGDALCEIHSTRHPATRVDRHERLVAMNTGEILKAAAARVRQGWIRGWTGRGADGPNCAVGAINVVRRGDADYEDDEDPAQELLTIARVIQSALQLPDHVNALEQHPLWMPVGAITQWNNASEQTAENVAAGLEYAALLWEQEQSAQAVSAVATPVAVGKAPQFAKENQ